MQMKNNKIKLSLILCIVLIAAMALFTIGCNNTSENDKTNSSDSLPDEITYIGEGNTKFRFDVVTPDGTTSFMVHTNEKTVGDALLALELIAGDDDKYGLYVKTVNGISYDYDKDGKYWAFYVDDGYAMSGVTTTEIEENKVYSFKVEK